MHSKPIIGLPTQTLEEQPGQLPRCWVMSQRYVNVLVDAGAVPWLIPLLTDDLETLRRIYDNLDGVFLPGGVDIDPEQYREQRHPLCDRTDPDRDVTELTLVRWALEDRKPLLAVCRGVQILNVAVGGTLYQDLTALYPGAIKHDYFPSSGEYSRDYLSHSVRIAEGTKLAALLGVRELQVNSMHHQGIKTLAPTLIPSAVAPDGLVEGVEMAAEHFVIGVQWHPESLVEKDTRMRRLFTALIDAALDFRYRRLTTVAAD